jgi:hypothetical protein
LPDAFTGTPRFARYAVIAAMSPPGRQDHPQPCAMADAQARQCRSGIWIIVRCCGGATTSAGWWKRMDTKAARQNSRRSARAERCVGSFSQQAAARRRCGAFMCTPKTNCDIESVDLAYNRLHDAIRPAQMCRSRKGSGYG